MNKEFIPYEQALALKELGFAEPCIYHYKRNEEGKHSSTPTFEMLTPFGDNHNKLESRASAPLYQQAFRWFREKHKLYHTINMFGDWDKPQYSYLVSGRTMNNPAHMWYFEDKDSHEEAELACLNKLIEITKKK
jgi:hypothetical protein